MNQIVGKRCPRGHAAMFHFKACPKCYGDLQECRDKDGPYLRCYQCGYHQDLNSYPPVKRRSIGKHGQGEYLPHLPEQPSNYKPWRERECLAWEKEDIETLP